MHAQVAQVAKTAIRGNARAEQTGRRAVHVGGHDGHIAVSRDNAGVADGSTCAKRLAASRVQATGVADVDGSGVQTATGINAARIEEGINIQNGVTCTGLQNAPRVVDAGTCQAQVLTSGDGAVGVVQVRRKRKVGAQRGRDAALRVVKPVRRDTGDAITGEGACAVVKRTADSKGSLAAAYLGNVALMVV